jgi:hypothetical protein
MFEPAEIGPSPPLGPSQQRLSRSALYDFVASSAIQPVLFDNDAARALPSWFARHFPYQLIASPNLDLGHRLRSGEQFSRCVQRLGMSFSVNGGSTHKAPLNIEEKGLEVHCFVSAFTQPAFSWQARVLKKAAPGVGGTARGRCGSSCSLEGSSER